jgi:hypothetical protein
VAGGAVVGVGGGGGVGEGGGDGVGVEQGPQSAGQLIQSSLLAPLVWQTPLPHLSAQTLVVTDKKNIRTRNNIIRFGNRQVFFMI